jgi:hypothetical protein
MSSAASADAASRVAAVRSCSASTTVSGSGAGAPTSYAVHRTQVVRLPSAEPCSVMPGTSPMPRPSTASPAASAAVENGPGPGSPRGSPGTGSTTDTPSGERSRSTGSTHPSGTSGTSVSVTGAPVTRCGSSAPVTRVRTSSYAASPASQADAHAASTPDRTLTRQPYVAPPTPAQRPRSRDRPPRVTSPRRE